MDSTMLKKPFLSRLAIDVAGKCLVIAVVLVFGRHYSVEEYGFLVLIMAYANVFYVFTDFGTHILLLRDLPASKSPEKTWSMFFGLKTVLTLVSLAAGLLCYPLFYAFRHYACVFPILVWLVGNTLYDFLNQTCNAQRDLGAAARITLIHRGAFLSFSLMSVFLGLSWVTLCYAIGFGSALGAFLSFLYCRSRFPFIRPAFFDTSGFGIFRRSVPLALAGFFNTMYLRAGLFVLPRFGMVHEAGIYGAAFKLFEAGLILPAALTTVTTPALSREYGSKPAPEFVRRAGRLFVKIALSAALLVPIGWLAAPWAVRIAYGAKYAASADLLRVLFAVNAMVLVSAFLSHLFVIIHRIPTLALIEASGLGLSFILSFTLIGRYGVKGAPVAAAATVLFVLLLGGVVIRRMLNRTPIHGEPS
jgi:O-antigen/teichoic acid export membrane protein